MGSYPSKLLTAVTVWSKAQSTPPSHPPCLGSCGSPCIGGLPLNLVQDRYFLSLLPRGSILLSPPCGGGLRDSRVSGSGTEFFWQHECGCRVFAVGNAQRASGISVNCTGSFLEWTLLCCLLGGMLPGWTLSAVPVHVSQVKACGETPGTVCASESSDHVSHCLNLQIWGHVWTCVGAGIVEADELSESTWTLKPRAAIAFCLPSSREVFASGIRA